MTWDWEKLKQQQQGRGGAPPQMDEIVERIRKVKFPGGPLFIVLILIVALLITSVFTVKQNAIRKERGSIRRPPEKAGQPWYRRL